MQRKRIAIRGRGIPRAPVESDVLKEPRPSGSGLPAGNSLACARGSAHAFALIAGLSLLLMLVVTSLAAGEDVTTSQDPQQLDAAQLAADQATKAADAIRTEVTKAFEQSADYVKINHEIAAAQAGVSATSPDEATHNAAVAKLTNLKVKLAQMRTDSVGGNKKLRDAQDLAARLTASYHDMKGAIEHTRAARAADAATLAVSASRLNTLGERYNDMRVKLVNVQFRAAGNQWVELLPGVRQAPDDAGRTINEAALQNWIGFSVVDGEKQLFPFVFADKLQFGDKVADMKEGTACTIYGKVVKLDHPGWYGVVVERIER